jgi:hypothetical protein
MVQLIPGQKRSPLLPLLVSLVAMVLLTIMLLQHTASQAALPKTPPLATHGRVNILQSGTQVTLSSSSLTLMHGLKNTGSLHIFNQTTMPETVLGSNSLIFTVPVGEQVLINVPIGQTTFTLQSNTSANVVVTVK